MLKDIRLLWFCSSIVLLSVVALTPFHQSLPYLWWRYLHILAAAMYSGIVVISALFEWGVARRESKELFALYHELVTAMDKRIITVSLSVLMISAIALMAYRGLALWRMDLWPFWSSAALILLSITGIVWSIFDVQTQGSLSALIESEKGETEARAHQRDFERKRILKMRHYINIFSVSTIPTLYYLMIFKPQ